MFVIVTYHHVTTDRPDGHPKLWVSVETLREQLAAIAPLARGLTAAMTEPGPGVVVTFDDGYANFHDLALPVIVAEGIPVTCYVSTGKVGRAVFEDDYGTTMSYMTVRQLRRCAAAGVDVQLHGHSHRRLSTLVDDVLDRELRAAVSGYEAIMAAPPRHFCYPYGDVDRRALAALAGLGLASATTCIDGANDESTPPLLLRRIAAEKQWTGDDLLRAVHETLDGAGRPW